MRDSIGSARDHLQCAPFAAPSPERLTRDDAGGIDPGWTTRLVLEGDEIGVLRRALEARARDMQRRLGGEPGDDGYRREAGLATRLLRQVEGLEREAGLRPWSARHQEES